MDSYYFYDETNKVVRFVSAADSTFRERVRSVIAMAADDKLPDQAQVPIDVSAVKLAPTVAEIESVPSMVRLLQMRFNGKVAIYNPTVGHHSLSLIPAILSGSERCRAFLAEKDALAWLAEN